MGTVSNTAPALIALVYPEAERTRTCLLEGSARVWFVEAGRADVFAVQVQDGKPKGNRRHVCRARTGDLVFGTDSDREGGYGLLAVGSTDTRLVEMDIALLKARAGDPVYAEALAEKINAWVVGLSEGISIDVLPKESQEIEVEQEVEVPDGTAFNAKHGVFWVRHLDGKSRFMGNEALPTVNGTGYFPITRHTWLETHGVARLYGSATRDLVEEGGIWEGLDLLHEAVRACVRFLEARDAARARARLAHKLQSDQKATENAFSYLAGVMSDEGPAPVVHEDRASLLLSVCRLVGAVLDLPIVDAPEAATASGRQDQLGRILRASHIRSRRVVLRDQWWLDDNGPLLGQIAEDRRPVALLPVGSNRYMLHDPATGTVKPVDAEVAETLEPFAYSFFRPFPEGKLGIRDVIKFGLAGSRKDLFMIVLMGVLVGLLGLLNPIATGLIFNAIIPGAERSQLFQITVILIVSAIAIGLFQLTRSLAILRINGKMGGNVQAAVWDRLLRLPVSFFKDYNAGDLASRAMGMSSIQQMLSGVVITTLLAAIFSVFDFGLLFYYSSTLALWSSLMVAMAMGVTFTLTYIQLHYQREIANAQNKISGMVLQFLTGIAKLRVAGAESKAFALWAERFSDQRKLQYKARAQGNWLVVFTTVFPVVASMVIYYQALNLMTDGQSLLTGDFLAFNSAFSKFLGAMLATNSALQAILISIPYFENAVPILASLPEVDESKSDPGELRGEIEIQHVSFRYTPDGPLILRDVSMRIEPGEFAAVVGTSGSGKSTNLRLLLGFETPESGSIFYDGQDLSGLDIQAVRRQIGVVLQNGRLLPGDIFTNIVGSSLATMDDAWRAARMAGFDKDVKQMPMGMHTIISEGGSTLSGGQRQRLMIARALVSKPRIIFFDEATSALDNRTQAIVSESLERLQATRIVIAHRLSTVQNADRIFVMDAGRVIESGNYEELMAMDGVFADLARRQIA